MTRRTLVILVVIYLVIVGGLFWASYSPAVRAVMVSAEVRQSVTIEVTEPEVVAEFEQGIPGTWNPQEAR